MKRIIRKVIGNDGVNNFKYQISFIYKNKFKHLKYKRKILYFLTPKHGNLGDQAIAYASRRFLEDKFKEYEIIEINCIDTYSYTKSIKYILNDEDIIFLHGGGNMGDHYIHEEIARRHIIKNFKENKIISFTQTIYFSDTEIGQIEFDKTKRLYNSHNNLIILAREEKSFDIMSENFTNNKIIKCPDIVFYLNNKINIKNTKRTNIMTCLRKDKETYVSMDKKQEFLEKLNNKYDNIVVSDTVVDYPVSQDDREKELFNLWTKFYNSKVVITDRLHGMIFCAITKTPCIVTRSLDHKVVESYKWIKDLNYIRMVEGLDFDEIDKIIEELSNLEHIDEFDFDKEYFDKLKDYIL